MSDLPRMMTYESGDVSLEAPQGAGLAAIASTHCQPDGSYVPGVVFVFTDHRNEVIAKVVLPLTLDDAETVGRMVSMATAQSIDLADAGNEGGEQRVVGRVREQAENLSAVLPPDALDHPAARAITSAAVGRPVLCPGCGRRLFGEVAATGVCLACDPS